VHVSAGAVTAVSAGAGAAAEPPRAPARPLPLPLPLQLPLLLPPSLPLPPRGPGVPPASMRMYFPQKIDVPRNWFPIPRLTVSDRLVTIKYNQLHRPPVGGTKNA